MILEMEKLEYVSDYVIGLLKGLGVEYIAVNPGASVKALLDSTTYLKYEAPKIILCLHEEIAVGVAHGYSKAKGKPMAVLLHDVVGLLNASMAIFNAWCDNSPLMVVGGTGPLRVEKRRPWIDWVHTAISQGKFVEDFVKWYDQPTSLEGCVLSLIRGYRVAMSDPKGPVYVCLSQDLQEERLGDRFVPNLALFSPPELGALDVEVASKVEDELLRADFPVIVSDFVGRNKNAFYELPKLAEASGAALVDLYGRLNFPNNHPLDLTGSSILSEADTILALDVKDLYGALSKASHYGNVSGRVTRKECKIFHVTAYEPQSRGNIADYQRLQEVHFTAIADTAKVIRQLVKGIQEKVSNDNVCKERIEARKLRIKERHEQLRRDWLEEALSDVRGGRFTPPSLAYTIWDVIKGENWVIGAGSLGGRPGWERRLWVMDRPYRYFGHSWGGGLGYNLPAAIGVALAVKEEGRIILDFQPDGDLLYVASALWTAAKLKLPLLVILLDNQGYRHSWQHALEVAKRRGRDLRGAEQYSYIVDPAVNYVKLAEAYGVMAFGPFEDLEGFKDSLKGTIKEVKKNRPVLLHVKMEK